MSPLLLATGVLILLTALAVSRFACEPIARRYRQAGRLDRPGGRKTQSEAIPYGGGLAVFGGFSVATLGGLLLVILHQFGAFELPAALARHADGVESRSLQLLGILAGASAMLVMGRIDDRRGMGVGSRILLQFGAAALVAAVGLRITLFVDSEWLHYLLTVLWIVFVTNCFNFVDNMDGLLVGLALSSAMTLFCVAAGDHQLFVAAFSLALAGALIGVLPANRPPARLYLGDEGSMFIGFLFACLTVALSYQSESAAAGMGPLPFGVPFLALAVPVADGLLVTTSRLRRGLAPWTPGHDHLSHRLAGAGFGSRGAVALLVGFSFAGGGLVAALYGTDAWHLSAAAAMTAIMGACVWTAVGHRNGKEPTRR